MIFRNTVWCVAGIFILASMATAQDATPRPAKVAQVTASSDVISRSYPATVLPSQEIELSFKVPGQIVALPVLAASQVAEGDVIAQIDTRDYENQIALYQSQIDQAVAQLEALRAGARAEEIAALEAAVESAEAQVDQAREALTRTEELLERGVSTQAQLEGAQAQFRVATANLTAQQEQLRIGQVGGRPEDIAAAEAALRGIEAQLKVAQDSLSDTTLVAPFDGIIARRDIDNFTNVQAGQTVVLLQALNPVHLAFDIPSTDIPELSRNGPDQITNIAVFDALPNEEFTTELVEFSVQPDSTTQTYRGRVSVTLSGNEVILPGMVANVVASTDGPAAQLTAPLSAIAASPEGDPFVWVVDDAGSVSARTVELGAASGANVIVTGGISEGDTVVSAGVSEIIEGMIIRPITAVGN